MLFLNALRCVGCGSGGLQGLKDYIVCPNCSRTYPVRADVPVMFSDATVIRGPLMDPAVVRGVLEAMDLPADPINALRIRRASGARARFGDQLVTAESAQFLERVRSSGHMIPTTEPEPEPPAQAESADGSEAPRCRWVTDYIPRAAMPGQEILVNVRFENTGIVPMRHAGTGRISIANEWRNPEGMLVPSDDLRTPLPLDLPPGQALTLPVRIRPPDAIGLHTLSIKMVQEGVRWLQPEYGPLWIRLEPDAAIAPPPHWQVNDNKPASYAADQDRGGALLRAWLAGFGPAPRLLELGGNAQPFVARIPGEAYNVDVDLLGLQVGCVIGRACGRPVHHVCADATNLPFPEAFFDAVIIFASLHHFPDPVTVLRNLRAFLRPGGFIGLFCEPVGQIWPGAVDPLFVAELRRGVNEQSFSLVEYAGIFRAARLDASEVIVDYNSLKARLVPAA